MRVARPRVPRESTARGGGCTRLARLPAQPRPACARSALCALPTVAGLLGLRRHPVPIVRSLRPPPVRPRTPCPRAVYAILARQAGRLTCIVSTIEWRNISWSRVRASTRLGFGLRSSVRSGRFSPGPSSELPDSARWTARRARGPARRLSAPLRRTGVYCFHVGFLTIRAGTMPTACRPSASRGRLHHWGCPAPSS